MFTRKLLGITGLLLLFVLSACGGGSKTSPNTTEDGGISNVPELTKPQIQGTLTLSNGAPITATALRMKFENTRLKLSTTIAVNAGLVDHNLGISPSSGTYNITLKLNQDSQDFVWHSDTVNVEKGSAIELGDIILQQAGSVSLRLDFGDKSLLSTPAIALSATGIADSVLELLPDTLTPIQDDSRLLQTYTFKLPEGIRTFSLTPTSKSSDGSTISYRTERYQDIEVVGGQTKTLSPATLSEHLTQYTQLRLQATLLKPDNSLLDNATVDIFRSDGTTSSEFRGISISDGNLIKTGLFNKEGTYTLRLNAREGDQTFSWASDALSVESLTHINLGEITLDETNLSTISDIQLSAELLSPAGEPVAVESALIVLRKGEETTTRSITLTGNRVELDGIFPSVGRYDIAIAATVDGQDYIWTVFDKPVSLDAHIRLGTQRLTAIASATFKFNLGASAYIDAYGASVSTTRGRSLLNEAYPWILSYETPGSSLRSVVTLFDTPGTKTYAITPSVDLVNGDEITFQEVTFEDIELTGHSNTSINRVTASEKSHEFETFNFSDIRLQAILSLSDGQAITADTVTMTHYDLSDRVVKTTTLPILNTTVILSKNIFSSFEFSSKIRFSLFQDGIEYRVEKSDLNIDNTHPAIDLGNLTLQPHDVPQSVVEVRFEAEPTLADSSTLTASTATIDRYYNDGSAETSQVAIRNGKISATGLFSQTGEIDILIKVTQNGVDYVWVGTNGTVSGTRHININTLSLETPGKIQITLNYGTPDDLVGLGHSYRLHPHNIILNKHYDLPTTINTESDILYTITYAAFPFLTDAIIIPLGVRQDQTEITYEDIEFEDISVVSGETTVLAAVEVEERD